MKKRIPVKLKCSQMFLFAARCKFCKSFAKDIYFNLSKYVSTSSVYYMQSVAKSYSYPILSGDNYLISVSTKEIKLSNLFDSSSIKIQKFGIPNSKFKQNTDQFIAVASCQCGHTRWSFIDSAREHVQHRKCQKLAPHEIKTPSYKFLS